MTTTVTSTGITFSDGSVLSTANVGQVGFRNKIRNGAMLIDQRNTATTAVTAGTSVNSTALVVGTRYIITSTTGTNFTTVGASANTVGVSFIATGTSAGGTGTAVTAPYATDGWCVNAYGGGTFTAQQVADAPTGFTKSLKCTVGTADATLASTSYYTIQQMIEGQELIGAAFGGTSAATVALSFWVKTSVAGTYVVALQNAAQARSYPASFTVSSAGTWQKVSVVIAGDTTGTWATDATNGCSVIFTLSAGTGFNGNTLTPWNAGNALSLAAGTNTLIKTSAATFQITGVQLELNTAASSFEYPWMPAEISRNQRFFYRSTAPDWRGFQSAATTAARVGSIHPVPMNRAPTVSYSGTINIYSGALTTISSIITNYSTTQFIEVDFGTPSGTTGAPVVIYQGGGGFIDVTAELAS